MTQNAVLFGGILEYLPAMALERMRDRIAKILPEREIDSFFDALAALSANPRKSIRFNPLRPGAKEFWLELGLPLGQEISWCSKGYWIESESLRRPEAELFLAAGMGYVQEASAMEVVEALDLQPGVEYRVLDLCAAPGGKSSQIGEMLQGKGLLVSNEVDRERVRLLDALLLRQGVSRSTVYSLYSRDLAEVFPRAFDRILVDAPCSSESFFAKRNEKREDVSDSEVRRCSKKQRKILNDAAAMAASGAKLVYSTCTYSHDENENVVEAFLEQFPDWNLLRTGRRFPHRDEVPGGFFAVLQAPEAKESANEKASNFQRRFSSNGLVRKDLNRWNGERDLYASLMAGDPEAPFSPTVELTLDEALEFCRGRITDEVIRRSSKGVQIVTWNGKRLGGLEMNESKRQLVLPKSLWKLG